MRYVARVLAWFEMDARSDHKSIAQVFGSVTVATLVAAAHLQDRQVCVTAQTTGRLAGMSEGVARVRLAELARYDMVREYRPEHYCGDATHTRRKHYRLTASPA